jgi:hypothetical protein
VLLQAKSATGPTIGHRPDLLLPRIMAPAAVPPQGSRAPCRFPLAPERRLLSCTPATSARRTPRLPIPVYHQEHRGGLTCGRPVRPGGPTSRADRIVQAPKPAPTRPRHPRLQLEQLDERGHLDLGRLDLSSVSRSAAPPVPRRSGGQPRVLPQCASQPLVTLPAAIDGTDRLTSSALVTSRFAARSSWRSCPPDRVAGDDSAARCPYAPSAARCPRLEERLRYDHRARVIEIGLGLVALGRSL